MSKKEVRMARQAALEARKLRERLIRIGAIAAAAVVVVGGLVWLALALSRGGEAAVASEPDPDIVATEITVPGEGASHLPTGQKAAYNHYPPSSGPHWNQQGVAPLAWGYYADPVPPESWVHNLEHGGIVILYNCPAACPEMEASLQRLAGLVPDSRFGTQKVIITPDPAIDARVVALAWTRQMDLSDYDQARLLDFYKRWVDSGPELTP